MKHRQYNLSILRPGVKKKTAGDALNIAGGLVSKLLN
jgi:hypothetical protein